MDIIQSFKDYLHRRNITNVLTIKNYLSDLRHFIAWYEKSFGAAFSPEQFNEEIITLYEGASGSPIVGSALDADEKLSHASLKRHLSSLRQFAKFIYSEGYVTKNPFESLAKAKETQAHHDAWRIQEFKDYLKFKEASELTIKNYVADVHTFRRWYQHAVEPYTEIRSFPRITNEIVEEYKRRLIEQKQSAPRTVNRKLSSLRKFVEFAIAGYYLTNEKMAVPRVVVATAPNVEPTQVSRSGGISLDAIGEQQLKLNYSGFAPIRLAQRLLVFPYLAAEHAIAGKVAGLIAGTTITAGVAKSVAPLVSRLPHPKHISDILRVKGYSKEFYAPHAIALDTLTPLQRLIHHLRHTRPDWYHTYHRLPVVHYIHFALLVVFCAGVGISLYRGLVADNDNALFAAPASPPRILSFQGRLTDNLDNPITTATDVRFAIYDDLAASGSALLWQEVHHETAPDQDGIFSVLLGTNTTIPQTLFAENSTLYLGVTIESTPELTPRRQIASVAYAANSETLQGMLPITDGSAGQTNVVLALDSSGDLTIGGSATPTFAATGGQFELSGNVLLLSTTTGTDTDVIVQPDGIGKIDLRKPLVNTSTNGNLVPGGVEVNDKFGVLATESAVAAFTVQNNDVGDLFTASSSGTTRFTIANDGKITAPIYNTAGGIFYANGSGTFAQTTAGLSGECLQSTGGSTPTWGSCGSGALWRISQGTISPLNDTLDFLVGANATSSAKFAVTNINGSSIPVASVSATTVSGGNGNGIALSGNGSIQSLRMNNLILGGSTTGNIVFTPGNGSGRVGLLTANPLATFDVRAGSGTIPVASISGQTIAPALLVDNAAGSGDQIVASKSGETVFRVDNDGNLSVGPNGTGKITAAIIDPYLVQNQYTTGNTQLRFQTMAASNGDFIFQNQSTDLATLLQAGQLQLEINGDSAGLMIGEDTHLFRGDTNRLDLATGDSFNIVSGNLQIGGSTVIDSSANATFNDITISGTCTGCIAPGTLSPFQEANATIFANNSTVDFLFGGQATSSANFRLAGTTGDTTPTLLSLTSDSTEDWNKVIDITHSNDTDENSSVLAIANTANIGSAAGNRTIKNLNLSLNPTLTAASTILGIHGIDQALNLSNTTLGDATSDLARINAYGNSVSITGTPVINQTDNDAGDSLYNVYGTRSSIDLDPTITAADEVYANFYGIRNDVSVTNTGDSGYHPSVYGSYNYSFGNLGTTGSTLHVGSHNRAAGTADHNYGSYSEAAGATNNYGGFFYAAGTGTTNYGILVGNITGATDNVGVYISGADQYSLYLASTAGNAASGITFAGDTTLYRSAANTLRTDDAFNVNGSLNITSAGAISAATGITSSGNITFSTFSSNGGILYTNGSGQLAQATAGTSDQCLHGGTTPSFSTCGDGASNWVLNTGAGTLSPINNTVDLLFGGSATASAKFAVLNVNTNAPVASISAQNASGQALSLGADGTIQTTRRHTLTLGGGTTGNIIIDGGSGLISLLDNTSITGDLTLSGGDITGANNAILDIGEQNSGDFTFNGDIILPEDGFIGLSASTPRLVFDSTPSPDEIDVLGGSLDLNSNLIQNIGNGGTDFTSGGGLTLAGTLTANGAVTLGDGGDDIAINSNDWDISGAGVASGFTGFSSSGTITFSTFSSNGGVLYTNGSGTLAQATAGTSDQCLKGGTTPSFGDCSAGVTSSPFQVTAGAINPFNSTLDFLIGGQATASADFAVLNVNGTGPATASVSGNLIVMPNNGAGGRVGIGTISPNSLFKLDVVGNGTNGQIKVDTNSGSLSGVGFYTNGTSRSFVGFGNDGGTLGTTGLHIANYTNTPTMFNTGVFETMRIDTDGDLGIGTTAPDARLEINHATGDNLRLTYNDSNGSATNFTDFSLASDGDLTIDSSGGLVTIADALTISGTTTVNGALDANGQIELGDGGDTFSLNSTALDISTGGAISGATGIVSSGTITFSTFSSNGGILYTNGSGQLAQATAGTSDQCLKGGTTPSFGSCDSSTSPFQVTAGAINPFNSTLDFLVGGQSTASATFAVLNNSSGIPTATISGNFIVMPRNGAGGNVGIGTINPSARLALAGGNFIHTAAGDPSLAGTYDTSGIAADVYISGGYAYVADNTAGLEIIDISDPNAPDSVSTYSTGDTANGVHTSGNYAYVANNAAGLEIIDISNPSNPSSAGTLDTAGIAEDVYMSGKYAYVAGGAAGLQVIDVTDPSNPLLVGTHDTTHSARRVYIMGKYAYVADNNAGFEIIDISDPSTPLLVGEMDTSGFARDVYVSGKYLYVADSNAGLEIFDISDPANPDPVGTYDTAGSALGVYISGKYAYVADNTAGLHVIDVSNPASPSSVGTYNTDGTALGVYISGKYAYVAGGGAGLQIIDINGIETPSLYAGNIATNDITVTENGVFGNNLYVENGLNVGNGGIYSQGSLGVFSGFGTNVIEGQSPGNALLALNQKSSQDIFTASASGTTRFTIGNAGDIGLTSGFGSAGQCLQSAGAGVAATWGSCGGSQTPWTSNIDADGFDLSDLGTLTFDADVSLSRGATNRLDLASGDSFNIVSGNLQIGGSTIITSGRIIRPPDGGANAPVYTFNTDTDTGLFRGGTDILGFTTGGSEAMRIDASGRIGIGTTAAPINSSLTAKFNVLSDLGTSPAASISANTAFTSLLVTNDGVGDIIVASQAGNSRLTLDNSGNLLISGLYTGFGSDFAEYFKKANPSEQFTAGLLVCQTETGGVTKCNADNPTHRLIGAVSDDALIVGNGDKKHNSQYVLVGLVGQLGVRAQGNIKAGDPLTISTTSGIARIATEESQIIGYALEDNADGTKARVRTTVQPKLYRPNLAIDSLNRMTIQVADGVGSVRDAAGNALTNTGAFAHAVVGTLRAGAINAQQATVDTLSATGATISNLAFGTISGTQATISNIATTSLNASHAVLGSVQIGTENVTIAGTSLRDYIAGIVNESISNLELTPNNSEIISPVAEIDNLATNVISPLAGDTVELDGKVKISHPELDSASESAQTDDVLLEVDGSASISGNLATNSLTTNGATVSGTLNADRIVANTIDGLDEKIAAGIANNQTATQSPITNHESPTDELSVGNLYADLGVFSQGLTVLGPTTTTQLTAMDSISVGTGFILEENSINTLGSTLEIQPLRQGDVSFMAGKILFDTEGNVTIGGNLNIAGAINAATGIFTGALQVDRLAANIISPLADSDLTIQLGDDASSSANLRIANGNGENVLTINQKGDIVSSGSATVSKFNLNLVGEALADTETTATATGSAGFATIKKNRLEITIANKNVTRDSLVYITPFGNTQNKVMSLLRQTPEDPATPETEGSFTVGISSQTNQDLQFNWLIVN